MFTRVFEQIWELGKRGKRSGEVPRVQIIQAGGGSYPVPAINKKIYMCSTWLLRYYEHSNPWFYKEIGRGKDRGRVLEQGTTVLRSMEASRLPHGVSGPRLARAPARGSILLPQPPHQGLPTGTAEHPTVHHEALGWAVVRLPLRPCPNHPGHAVGPHPGQPGSLVHVSNQVPGGSKKRRLVDTWCTTHPRIWKIPVNSVIVNNMTLGNVPNTLIGR